MLIDPNWKPDPAKVAEVIDDAKADVTLQERLVERIRDLLDDEERELHRRQGRVEQLRETWGKYGVEIPA